jgi:hypothetical protein
VTPRSAAGWSSAGVAATVAISGGGGTARFSAASVAFEMRLVSNPRMIRDRSQFSIWPVEWRQVNATTASIRGKKTSLDPEPHSERAAETRASGDRDADVRLAG